MTGSSMIDSQYSRSNFAGIGPGADGFHKRGSFMSAKRFTQSIFIVLVATAAVLQLAFAQQPDLVPVTDQVLQNPNPADWLRWRRDQSASAYSPLGQVNRQNVQKLRLAWAWAMESGRQEVEPIVYRGILYLPHTNGVVQALDGRTGALIWEYRRKLPKEAAYHTTRNIAIYRDKIYITSYEGYVVALDAKTGSVAWESRAGDYRQQLNFSSGPIVGDGRVFSGLTCAPRTPTPCFLVAHDAETGKELWRRDSIAGPGDPVEHDATWNGVPHDKRRKASFWLTGSYDSELRTVYWTTASASPYPEFLKGTGNGDVLYTNSILALDAATGKIKWFFQMQPRDSFDMDHQDNPILADVTIGGVVRKVVYVLGKPGILWAFDRVTGEHLWNRQLVAFQNIYEKIDPKTGKITKNEKIIPKQVGESQLVCPGMRGGKLFQSKAYDPELKLVYGPVSNACNVFEIVPLRVNSSGVNYERIVHMEGSGGKVGRLAAVSAATGEVVWTHDQRAAMGSVLTTAGGLVFAGDLHRYFRAFDSKTGKELWEIPLSAPVTGYPISYGADGKQYIAVAVGGQSDGTAHLARLYPELKVRSGSNILAVFSLGD